MPPSSWESRPFAWCAVTPDLPALLKGLRSDLSPGAGAPLLPRHGGFWTAWLPHLLVALVAMMLAGVSWHTLIEDFGVPNQGAAVLGITQASALLFALYWPVAGWWSSLGVLVAAAGGPWRSLILVSAMILSALVLERLAVGLGAAARFKQSAGLWFVPFHLVRDLAWVAAVVMWSGRRLLARPRDPAHSMRPSSRGDRYRRQAARTIARHRGSRRSCGRVCDRVGTNKHRHSCGAVAALRITNGVFERRFAQFDQCAVHVVGRIRQHRLHRLERLEHECGQRILSACQRGNCDNGKVAGQHGGAANFRSGDSGRSRDGVDEDALERALPELAEQQPRQEILFRAGVLPKP